MKLITHLHLILRLCAWIYTAILLYASKSHTYTALLIFNAINREIQIMKLNVVVHVISIQM